YSARHSAVIVRQGSGMCRAPDPKSTWTEVVPWTLTTRPRPNASCETRAPASYTSSITSGWGAKGLLGRWRRGRCDIAMVSSSCHEAPDGSAAPTSPPADRAGVEQITSSRDAEDIESYRGETNRP